MLAISTGVITAFEKAAAVADQNKFHKWCISHQQVLGVMSDGDSRDLLSAAAAAAGDLGISDNEFCRIWLQAAVMRMFPHPTAEQFLLLADIIFDSDNDEVRLQRLVDLRRGALA